MRPSLRFNMSLEASVLILLKQESETSDHVLSSSGLVSPRAVVALGRREISFMPSMASGLPGRFANNVHHLDFASPLLARPFLSRSLHDEEEHYSTSSVKLISVLYTPGIYSQQIEQWRERRETFVPIRRGGVRI